MDWSTFFEALPSGVYALLGTLFGGLITFFIQMFAHKREELRHARRLALEMAIAEWRSQHIRNKDTLPIREDLPVSVFLAGYTPFVEQFLKLAKKGAAPRALAGFIKSHDAAFAELLEKYRNPF